MNERWLVAALLFAGACAGSGSDVRPEQWRSRLRGAMETEVATREKRDELSRVLVDAADGGALDRLTQPEIEAAFGPAIACEGYELCSKQGFRSSDWYYLIGRAASDDIQQLPVLIIGFDPHGRVARVYTLRTH